MAFKTLNEGNNPVAVGRERLLGLVIVGLSGDELVQAALHLRRDSTRGHYPIFADTQARPGQEASQGPILDCLLDGYVTGEDDALTRAEQYWAAAADKTDLPVHNSDARLLSYLLMRPDIDLAPIRDWASPEIYRYPLIEAFGGTDCAELLNRLAARGLIRRQSIVERLRLCPACHGGHALFVDICPNCEGLEIEQDQSLHCFTCGHVAGERAFLAGAALQCPNCRTRLRHIGTDYDRPMEHYGCRQCNERFIDPTIIARCSICNHQTRPERLITREIGRYTLTEQGRVCVLAGMTDEIPSPVLPDGLITPPAFEYLLSWQSALADHHRQCFFTLLMLRMRRRDASSDAPADTQLARKLHELSQRIHHALEAGELATRTQEGEFWILMPQAGEERVRELMQTLETWLTDDSGRPIAGVDLQARMMASNDPRASGADGAALMQQLASTTTERAHA